MAPFVFHPDRDKFRAFNVERLRREGKADLPQVELLFHPRFTCW
jgi:hypothetical protein